MPKLQLLLICFGISIFYSEAQIGINTETPINLLHIDLKGDTNETQSITDDFILTNQGNIGLGAVPSKKLEIHDGNLLIENGNLIYNDGTQGEGLALMSDNNGRASWTDIPMNVVRGELNNNIAISSSWANITKSPLKLKAGKWMIIVKGLNELVSASSSFFTWFGIRNSYGVTLDAIGLGGEEGSLTPRYLTPQLISIIDLPTDDLIYVYAHNVCQCGAKMTIDPNFGGSYFYAIRLSFIN